MKKALVYASVASMIQQFNMNNIDILISLGYKVDVACNMTHGSTISDEKIQEMKNVLNSKGVEVYHIPIPRKLSAVSDIMKSVKMTKKLLDNRCYQLIHCQSPIGGVICRLAYHLSIGYKKAKMIYTAHGFHFYKGAPRKNWLLYYPVEWLCSWDTDVLITINQEDYVFAQRRMKAKRVKYVPGVGIDSNRIFSIDAKRDALCAECDIDSDSILMLSVGELNDNKNHKAVLEVLHDLPENVHYLICGQGEKKVELEQLAQTIGCSKKFHILGFRDDVLSIMKSCDIFVFPSKREGLSVALMEAMAAGKAVACSKIRGNTDLIDDKGGVLFDLHGSNNCGKAILTLLKSDLLAMGKYNAKKVQEFSKENINTIMQQIYL